MRQEAKRTLHEQNLQPAHSAPPEIISMPDVRKAYNEWLDRRGFPRETFKLGMINRRKK